LGGDGRGRRVQTPQRGKGIEKNKRVLAHQTIKERDAGKKEKTGEPGKQNGSSPKKEGEKKPFLPKILKSRGTIQSGGFHGN